MSAFDDLLAQPAAPSTPVAKPSAFDALLQDGSAATPSPPPAPAPKSAARRRVNAAVAGTADLVDLGLVGLPAMAVGVVADIGNRIKGLVDGRSRTETLADSEAITKAIQEAAGTPIRKLLTDLGAIDQSDVTAIGQVMDKASSILDKAGADLEVKTAGVVRKQDFLSVVNTTFASLGGRAAAIGAKKYGERADAKAFEKATAEMLAKAEGESAISAPSREAAAAAAASRAQAEADLAARASERAAQNVVKRRQPSTAPQESAETARLKAEVDAAYVKGAGAGGTPPPELLSALVASQQRDFAAARRAREFYAQGRPAARQPNPAAPNETLTAAIDKQATGRAFDLSPEERIALRGMRQRMDARTATAVAVGATGLGLAMAFEADPAEAALAIGAGALVGRAGPGLTLEALRTMPDAAPLGSILERSAYSLNTIEALPQNRFEFSKASIEQLLKRPEVTKAERDVLAPILAETPGETITAKQLMEGVKVRTGDFELKAVPTEDFASYGLEAINRVPARDGDFMSNQVAAGETPADATTTIYQSPLQLGDNNHFGDPNYFAHTRSFEEGGVKHVVEMQSDLAQRAGKVLTPEERAGLQTQFALADRLSLVVQDSFKTLVSPRSTAPQLAQAVRSYIAAVPEEVQLDYKLGLGETMLKYAKYFAEKPNPDSAFVAMFEDMRDLDAAGKVDEIVDYGLAVLDEASKLGGELDEAGRALRDKSGEIGSLFENAFSKESARMRTWRAEVDSKLKTSGSIEPIAPMLKNWHKRLVREELASASRAGQPVVRFATADTVAKVEGWPTQNDAITRSARESVEAAERNLSAMEARLQTRGGATPAMQAEARELIPVIREDVRRAREAYAAARDSQAPAFLPEHQGIYDRYSTDVTKFLKQLGGKEVTDSAGHTWLEVPVDGAPGGKSPGVRAGNRVLQFGSADPKLMAAATAIGAGTLLALHLSDKENRLGNAAATAAFIGFSFWAASRSPAIAEIAQQAVRGAEGAFGNVSAEMRTISQPVLRRLTNHALDELAVTYQYMQRVGPFVEMLSTIPETAKARVNAAVLTGRREDIIRAFAAAGKPGLVPEWEKARSALADLGKGLVDSGRLKTLLPDYYPRIVTDVEGLKNYLGTEYRTGLEEALAKAETDSFAKRGEPLSALDISVVTNKHIEGLMRSSGPGKAGFLKERKLDTVSEEMAKFYAPAVESLPIYVASVVKEIERAKFFGKNLVRKDGVTAIDASIGNIVSAEIAAKRMKPEDYSRAVELLRSRFGPGEQGTNRLMSSLRDVGYMALLGNVLSALQNLADIPGMAFIHGVIPTAKAAVASAGKPGWKITAADLGMAKYLGEEFVTRGQANPLTVMGVRFSTANAVRTVFKWSGFQVLDTAMKETKANAAMLDYQGKARTPRGQAQIERRYGEYFGADLPQLLADLRSGEKTRLVYELAFRELSDAQPTTRLEVPKFYLDNPNLRPLWMLKSFSIKQLNLLRERGFREIARGNVAEGTKFVVGYGIALGLGGATMEFIANALLGRDDKLEWGDIPVNALKSFGLSDFVVDKFRQGKPGEAAASALLPPVGILGDVVNPRTLRDPDTGEEIPNTSAAKYFPWVGRIVESRYLGGADRYNERKAAREEREADAE